MRIAVQSDPFDFGAEASLFTSGQSGAGAVVTFCGLVRDIPGGLRYMEIEHYPGMTQSAIERIAGQAAARWKLADCLVIHRHGKLEPGALIMMVATAAPHRRAAFEAAEYLMDYLKSRAPFWKREVTSHGASWVDAKAADEAALDRWAATSL